MLGLRSAQGDSDNNGTGDQIMYGAAFWVSQQRKELEREQAQATIRQRVVEVWEMLRRELHAGIFECIVLKEGASIKIEPDIWATDGAQPLFRECVSDGSEIFVSDKIVSLSRSGSKASASEASRLDSEGAGSTGEDSAPPEFVPTPKIGRKRSMDKVVEWFYENYPGGDRRDDKWREVSRKASKHFSREIDFDALRNAVSNRKKRK